MKSNLLILILNKINSLFFYFRTGIFFHDFGRNSWVNRPYRFDGKANISVGKQTSFQRGVWLYSCGIDGINSNLSIGSNCVFGYNNHITCVRSVIINDFVLTANNVYISDNLHGYDDIEKPIIEQQVKFKAPVSIGEGSWLGENVCVIGASVGKNCVIGANSVVTHNIPDYSVAVGSPAVVIKKYNAETAAWEKYPCSKQEK